MCLWACICLYVCMYVNLHHVCVYIYICSTVDRTRCNSYPSIKNSSALSVVAIAKDLVVARTIQVRIAVLRRLKLTRRPRSNSHPSINNSSALGIRYHKRPRCNSYPSSENRCIALVKANQKAS